MIQRLFILAIALVCLLWIVVSYLPGVQAMLPTIAFTGGGAWLAWMGFIALIVFVALQLWLVYTTVVAVQSYRRTHRDNPFRLKLGTEFFWTALPIVMTVVVAWASYGLWRTMQTP